MTTVTQISDYKIIFNGSSTYFVVQGTDQDCIFATDTLRKAKNFFNKYLSHNGNHDKS